MKIATILTALVTACVTPMSVMALSCLPPLLPIELLNLAASNPDNMSVGHGTLTGEPQQIRPNDLSWEGHFVFNGLIFAQGQHQAVHNVPVTVGVYCDGPWCGGAIPLAPFLAGMIFVFDKNPASGDFSLSASPCSPMNVIASEAPNLDRLAHCLMTGTCTADDIRR